MRASTASEEQRAALRAAQALGRLRGARPGPGCAPAPRSPGRSATAPLSAATAAARRAVSAELVPEWEPPMPPPAATAMPPTARPGAAAVYLPACVNRIFGRDPAGYSADNDIRAPLSLPAALVAVSLRAGKPVWIPTDVAGTCCATPWTSKGYRNGAEWMSNRTIEDLWRWSEQGALPVIIDASSCTHGLLESAALLSEQNAEQLAAITILDSIAWASEHLLARAARSSSRSGPPSSTRPARRRTSASTMRSRGWPERLPRTSSSPTRRPAAASPATGASCTRS